MSVNKKQNKEKDAEEKKVVTIDSDLMTLKELGELSKEELLTIVNALGKVNNKSSINIMNEQGYAFKFSELETVAQYVGFIKDSGTSREVHYVAEDIVEKGTEKKEGLDLRDEIFEAARDKKNIKRTPLFIYEEDATKFKEMVKENSFFGLKEAAQAVIFKRLMNGEKINK